MNPPALFIYWHTAPESADAAVAAAQAFQANARARHPGLQARLYRRHDADRGRVTLMETYASAAGLPAELASEAAQALAAWAPAGRQEERFEALD